VTFVGGEMTGGEMTMGRNDRIPCRVLAYLMENVENTNSMISLPLNFKIYASYKLVVSAKTCEDG